MNETWIEVAQCFAGLIGFAMFFLPTGFLLANIFNPCGFRRRSSAEKLLWSVCLSLPLSIQICVMGGRYLPPRGVVVLFLLLLFAALTALLLSSRKLPGKPLSHSSRATRFVFVLAGLLGLYLILAITDIQIGHRLYVSSVLYDWSVRVPMVAAAMRSGVPPINGLSALSVEPAPLRYFYFWYVASADVAQMFGLPARAGLTASCVWAAWSFLSVFFLLLKYLLATDRHIRRYCGVAFLVLAVMGLDLIPTLVLLLGKNLHPSPEIEWWHQDRTPSLLSSAMYAPHHVAAFACLLTGLLMLSLTLRGDGADDPGAKPAQVAWITLFAGVCFASAAGCSILPTVTVAIVCLVWAADLIFQRQFATVAALGGSAITALLLARGFLHEVLGTAGAASGNFLSVRWRNLDFVQFYEQKYHLLTSHALLNQAILQAGVLAINLCDLGFFLFVLIHQIRRDTQCKLTVRERAMWAFLSGTAIPYFFLSSVSIASPNDLGVDSGFLLRVLLQMWAVRWVYVLWSERDASAWSKGTEWRRAGLVMAGACLVVGLGGEVFQVVWERLYFPLVGSQTLAIQLDMLTTDRLAERLYNIREGYRALNWSPATAAIQYNPIGPMQPALAFYTTHQLAASDIGCGTSFGGDYAACRDLMPSLLALYGNTRAGFERGRGGNDRQDNAAERTATEADALAMCGQLHLTALIAESTDSIWGWKNSWVWTMQPALANETVRIFRCPAS